MCQNSFCLESLIYFHSYFGEKMVLWGNNIESLQGACAQSRAPWRSLRGLCNTAALEPGNLTCALPPTLAPTSTLPWCGWLCCAGILVRSHPTSVSHPDMTGCAGWHAAQHPQNPPRSAPHEHAPRCLSQAYQPTARPLHWHMAPRAPGVPGRPLAWPSDTRSQCVCVCVCSCTGACACKRYVWECKHRYMCAQMHVFICVHSYVLAHSCNVCTWSYVHASVTNVFLHVQSYVCAYTHTHAYAHMCTCGFVYTACTCMHVHVCACVCICTYLRFPPVWHHDTNQE